ncbi:MAG: restriction endonuclease [Prosthecobacter sp.]|nr:restriction endonuclease [Prosthecobacter sp.]
MNTDIIHHYPPEILSLLVDTIPLLCRSKNDVLVFFKGAGVPQAVTADFSRKLAADRGSVNKYEIVREVLIRLNDKGETSLRERREVLKRVIEFEDFSTCWPTDQLKAKGLVAEIRRVVDVKDSFGRMRQEQEAERKKRLDDERAKIATRNERGAKLDQVKRDLYALFKVDGPQRRGKQLEEVLNRLFASKDILVREAFVRVASTGEGIVEQIDGVIEMDGEIYLVEMKWWDKPLGTGEVSQHLVRVFSRNCARGLLISYSGFTDPAIVICRESLSRMVVALCSLQEIVQLLEREDDLAEFLKEKVRAAVIDKNPHHRIYD